ncbi:hypothetical protein D3C85_943490 [compost metagenome]
MCLACSRPADEHDILRGICELQVGQITDPASVCTGSAEVEACQITMHGQFGHVHLMIHRAYGTICLFLLKQKFEQPFSTTPSRLLLGKLVLPKHWPCHAMPCRRSSLSSAIRPRTASLLIGGTEPGVACRIGDRRYLEFKAGFGGRRGCYRCQSNQDIQDVVCAQAA